MQLRMTSTMALALALASALAVAPAAPAAARPAAVPPAIYTDPAPDRAHPARMEVLHVPSGGVQINAVAYLASGAGTHPTLVLCHGWPGNEKNLDLAQAVRRAGWNVVTFNYRGSWGSAGSFRFAQNPDDALLGAGLISAANMGYMRGLDRDGIVKVAAGNAETLADTSPETMADELIANREAFDFRKAAPGLARKPLLVLSSDDGLAPQTDELIKLVRAGGGTRITAYHAATDHGWSDRRVDLAAHVIRWLQGLEGRRR